MMPIPRTPNVFGYTSGAGGAVTQITSKATAVTLDKLCGQITTHTGTIVAGTSASFTVNNVFVEAGDVPVVALVSGGTTNTYQLGIEAVAAGSFRIIISNVSAGNKGEVLVINFAVIKASAQ